LNRVIFGALVGLLIVAAIPYGTVEPWWKAAFVCAAFGLCIIAIVEILISGATDLPGKPVLLPMLALSAFAYLQTLSLGPLTVEPSLQVWNSISADPYQTRFFVLQLLALTVCLALLYRYARTEARIRILIFTILGIAVASAVFGILRQTTQHETGFILPLLKQNQGYGQFINKNHFAYLMEMAFGLGLGILVSGVVKKDRVLIYVSLLLPIWTGLVLSNSRGGILAMLTQIVVSGLLFLNSKVLPNITRTSVVRVALIVVLAVGVLLGTLWVGGDRLASNFEAAGTEFSQTRSEGARRTEIWRASLKMFAAHPLLGVGFGGYWIGITAYHDASGVMTPQEAHNDYLEILSSGGIIGFAIAIWFSFAVIRAARKNLSTDTGYMRAARLGSVLGIIGAAVHSLFDFGLHIIANAAVFITLLMIATTQNTDERRSRFKVLEENR
jgi:O-antigen ligase